MMDAVFLAAVERVLANEGGYVDNPADPGGATNFGISQRAYPDLDIANLTREQAIDIYYRDYWLKYGLQRLRGEIAGKMLDLCVNLGPEAAVLCLQRAMRANRGELEEDGILGPKTLATVNSYANPVAVLSALRSEAAARYRVEVARRPQSAVFIEGWLRRAYE